MLGAYTFWDGIWSIIVFFAWVMVVTWIIMMLIDNFRRTDHSGWAKAGWAIFLIFLPLIGVLTYTIARPVEASDSYDAGYGYAPSQPTSPAAELARLNELRTEGAISDAEFEDLKAKTIASS
jgi:NADH:ubiquinone oxidoreductase subunit 6 (subunit J)